MGQGHGRGAKGTRWYFPTSLMQEFGQVLDKPYISMMGHIGLMDQLLEDPVLECNNYFSYVPSIEATKKKMFCSVCRVYYFFTSKNFERQLNFFKNQMTKDI